jgi:hypothetical protein
MQQFQVDSNAHYKLLWIRSYGAFRINNWESREAHTVSLVRQRRNPALCGL